MSTREARWIRLLDGLAAACLFAMMALEFADVLGRYVVNRPVPGATEIKQYLLALTLFAAVPVVAWHDEHISISLIEGRFGATFDRWRRAFVRALAGVVMLAAGWYLFQHASMLATNRDVIGYLQLPVAPPAFAVSVLAAFTGALYLVAAWLVLQGRGLVSGPRDPLASAD